MGTFLVGVVLFVVTILLLWWVWPPEYYEWIKRLAVALILIGLWTLYAGHVFNWQ